MSRADPASEAAAVRLRWSGSPSAERVVVILPGLGLPSYVAPTARALAQRGFGCVVLDLPGFGSGGGLACRPDITSMGVAAADWVAGLASHQQVVVLGHSTGGQAALGTALLLQETRPDSALVLCGPTFQPAHRGLLGLAVATSTAYLHDSLREAVVVPDLLRGNVGVARIIASGVRDRPEHRLGALTLPLLLTAGRHDTYAPSWWLETLAGAASRSPAVTTAVLGGSHNNLFTHAEDLALLVDTVLGAPGAPA